MMGVVMNLFRVDKALSNRLEEIRLPFPSELKTFEQPVEKGLHVAMAPWRLAAVHPAMSLIPGRRSYLGGRLSARTLSHLVYANTCSQD